MLPKAHFLSLKAQEHTRGPIEWNCSMLATRRKLTSVCLGVSLNISSGRQEAEWLSLANQILPVAASPPPKKKKQKKKEKTKERGGSPICIRNLIKQKKGEKRGS